MALLIEKTSAEGFVVGYWRISPDVQYNVVDRRLTAVILPYVSATSRASDKPVFQYHDRDFDEARRLTLEGNDAETAIKTGEPRDALYAKAKTLAFFSGATDDI